MVERGSSPDKIESLNKGFSVVEMVIAAFLLSIVVGAVVILFSGTTAARKVEGAAEEIANFVRAVQSTAIEKEIPQAIFFSRKELLWNAYPKKEIEKLSDCSPNEGEVARKKRLKNDIEITMLWIDGRGIEITEEYEKGMAILIDEKGRMTETNIIVSRKDITRRIVVSTRKVMIGEEGKGALAVLGEGESLGPPLFSNEEAMICKTEPILSRGWQTIQINNVDKVKEVKLKIKSDIRLPSSSHIHAYVFPYKYTTKKIAHGVTGTAGIKTVFFSGIVFWTDYSNLGDRTLIPNATVLVKLGEQIIDSDTTNADGEFKFANLPFGTYTFEASADGYTNAILDNIPVNYEHNYLEIELEPDNPRSSGLYQSGQINVPVPLGEWDADNNILVDNAMEAAVPAYNNPKLYYLYKNNSQTLADYLTEHQANVSELYFYQTIKYLNPFNFILQKVPLNFLCNTGKSYFPTTSFNVTRKSWLPAVPPTYPTAGVYSKLASQPVHALKPNGNEVKQGEETDWLTIQTKNLPEGTEFLRIAVSAYHSKDEKDKAFNLYPTDNSMHLNEQMVNSLNLDYQTDPFVAMYPWMLWQNNPLWLSNYGYALKPLTRTTSNNILAGIGPHYGEIYENTLPYNNFWYGPVFLDWDKLLGEEGILWLLGWVSSTFGYDNWSYKQIGDTYSPEHAQDNSITTHKAAAPHFWLKSFAMLPYWYLFNYSSYFPTSNVPKRIQLPFILTLDFGEQFPIWENPICAPRPEESSSLAIGLMANPKYPLWLAALSPLFGQSKIICSPDLYSSYFYVMQRINHIWLDNTAWIYIQSNKQNSIAKNQWIREMGYPSMPNGNLDKWRLELANVNDGTGIPYPRATWWPWYTTIPWAKGVAFPVPSTLAPREGWEAPIVEAYPSDSLFPINSPSYTNYFNIIKNQPNTIYMSTAHYPLGIVQVVVKK